MGKKGGKSDLELEKFSRRFFSFSPPFKLWCTWHWVLTCVYNTLSRMRIRMSHTSLRSYKQSIASSYRPKLLCCSRSSLIDCCVTTRLVLLLSEKNYFLISQAKMEEIIVCSGHPTVLYTSCTRAQKKLKRTWKEIESNAVCSSSGGSSPAHVKKAKNVRIL